LCWEVGCTCQYTVFTCISEVLWPVHPHIFNKPSEYPVRQGRKNYWIHSYILHNNNSDQYIAFG